MLCPHFTVTMSLPAPVQSPNVTCAPTLPCCRSCHSCVLEALFLFLVTLIHFSGFDEVNLIVHSFHWRITHHCTLFQSTLFRVHCCSEQLMLLLANAAPSKEWGSEIWDWLALVFLPLAPGTQQYPIHVCSTNTLSTISQASPHNPPSYSSKCSKPEIILF